MDGRTEWTDGRTDDAKTISLRLRRRITNPEDWRDVTNILVDLLGPQSSYKVSWSIDDWSINLVFCSANCHLCGCHTCNLKKLRFYTKPEVHKALKTPAKSSEIPFAIAICSKFLLTLFNKVKYRDKQCGPRSDCSCRSSLI